MAVHSFQRSCSPSAYGHKVNKVFDFKFFSAEFLALILLVNDEKTRNEKSTIERFAIDSVSGHNCPSSCFKGVFIFVLQSIGTMPMGFFCCSTSSSHWEKWPRCHIASPVCSSYNTSTFYSNISCGVCLFVFLKEEKVR